MNMRKQKHIAELEVNLKKFEKPQIKIKNSFCSSQWFTESLKQKK